MTNFKFNKRSGEYWVGTIIMGLGLMGLIWTFYPILREEWLYRTGQVQMVAGLDSTYSIRIPAIGVSAPVITGVDPFRRQAYQAALQRGVAQALGTALPGEPGTQYLFAHSAEAPWRMTRINTAFYRLAKLKPGEEIIVKYQGQDFNYRVRELKTVWPDEVKYLKDQTPDQLVLQTCTPIGTDWKRLLVFAKSVQ